MRPARTAATTAMTALLGAIALAGPSGARSQEFDHTGGTPGPIAVISTRNTGGTEYVAAAPKPIPVRRPPAPGPSRHEGEPHKPAPHKPAPAKPVSPPATPTPAPHPPAGQGPVFPVAGPHSFGGPENRFGAGRPGHIHQGQDVLAAEGLPVLAPLAGTIVATGYQAAGAGWYATEHTTGAFDFFFAHCQSGSLAVKEGEVVAAGAQICRVGMTGDATGPHLHFEIWLGGWRAKGGYPIDPLPYLEAWERG
jgi:murein DD-endopeptidase MepM/ murein hydrolase activator NlpD